ncbi:MAG: hypothetical protein RQ745_07430 [Longimicrobiales bacterium]|nr:hypothetical protein [Longimicrobiales bacterium]
MPDRRGAANLGIPLMLGALVMLGGFLYWLATNAEPTPPPVVEEPSEEEEEELSAVTLNVDSLSLNGPPFYGQLVRIPNAAVGQELGENAFLVQSQQPFVAVLGPDLVAAGQGIPSGRFTLLGTLEGRTDSILEVWLEEGTVTPANELLADFATEYLVVRRIVPEAGGAGGEGSASGAGGAE